jgi:hypothetical protein
MPLLPLVMMSKKVVAVMMMPKALLIDCVL